MSLFDYDASLEEVLVAPSQPSPERIIHQERAKPVESVDERSPGTLDVPVARRSEEALLLGPAAAVLLLICATLFLYVILRRRKGRLCLASRWREDANAATDLDDLEQRVLKPLAMHFGVLDATDVNEDAHALTRCVERVAATQRLGTLAMHLRLESLLTNAAHALRPTSSKGRERLQSTESLLLELARLHGREPAEALRCSRLRVEAELATAISTDNAGNAEEDRKAAILPAAAKALLVLEKLDALRLAKRGDDGDASTEEGSEILSQAEKRLQELVTRADC
jgi:hypothetical protein